jgi:hypothetical protein
MGARVAANMRSPKGNGFLFAINCGKQRRLLFEIEDKEGLEVSVPVRGKSAKKMN